MQPNVTTQVKHLKLTSIGALSANIYEDIMRPRNFRPESRNRKSPAEEKLHARTSRKKQSFMQLRLKQLHIFNESPEKAGNNCAAMADGK